MIFLVLYYLFSTHFFFYPNFSSLYLSFRFWTNHCLSSQYLQVPETHILILPFIWTTQTRLSSLSLEMKCFRHLHPMHSEMGMASSICSQTLLYAPNLGRTSLHYNGSSPRLSVFPTWLQVKLLSV